MNTTLSPYDGYDGEELLDGRPDPGQQPPNPLLLVHRHLRGRYLLAGALGLVLGCPLAFVGYNALPPTYTSTGVINVAPTRPYILYENEFTQGMSSSGFESFVQSQSVTLQSQRILANAVQNEKLREAGWDPLPQGLIDLTEAMSVSIPRRGQDIFVSVTWDDPRLAQAATNAILDEYAKVAVVQEASELQRTIDTITDIRDEARRERDERRNRAYQLAEREGTDNLARLLEAKQEQIRYIEATILDIDMRLLGQPEPAPGEAQAPQGQPEADEDGRFNEATLAALAQRDRDLAALLDRRRQLQMSLANLRQRFGPAHRQIVAVEEELAGLATVIQSRAALAMANAPAGEVAAADPISDLRRRREQLRAMREAYNEEARRIGRVQLDIDRLREEAQRADEKFREADARLESLQVQKRDDRQGRISIAQRAETPLGPSTDRRLPLAAMGFMGGAGTGVGLVFLLGLLRPKYRYIDEVQEGAVRIMGAVPQLDIDDPAAEEVMGASVHQIRSAIDARLLGHAERGLVHLVTSAGPGEGKSTIALRLARSFAVSGKKTLVIDADLIGHRITSRLGLGGHDGFADAAVGGRDPLELIRPGGEEGLSALPAGGSGGAFSPERFSARAVSAVLDRLREHFGAIVVDTGPILGSLEAQAVVPGVDEVLLVVSRGRDVRAVRMAIAKLQRLGAGRVGVVFNRAGAADFERSTSMSVTSQRTSVPGPHGPRRITAHPGASD
jgi:polysaccharide biosynthesis transport protein